MSRYEVVVSNQAEQDLRGIYEYVGAQLFSPQAASKLLDQLEEAISSLAFFPERHRQYKVEPWRNKNLRTMTVGNYVVFYIPDNVVKVVTVLRVIYGGRDLEAQLERINKE